MGADANMARSPTLKNLRAIVQEVVSARDLPAALQLIVFRVRDAMKTEVCSVYLREPTTDRYVFMATEGLNKGLEGRFSLGTDEGLIGQVARREEPLNLEDAERHPHFKFIEGSGEESFKSFLGVPIVHQRQVLGVLVVQQRESRRFNEDDEAFLVTMSAQLAGIIAHTTAVGGLAATADTRSGAIAEFRGIGGAPGIGIGQIVVVAPPSDLNGVPSRLCDDPIQEEVRFRQAVARVRDEIRQMREDLSNRVRPEELALFDAYAMLLDDHAISGEISERILGGSWAPGAVSEVLLEHVRNFEAMEDPYIRDRATDLRDLGRRLLDHLQTERRSVDDFPPQTILVGEEIPASLIAEVPEHRLAGIVSVSGSGNSHVAILARACGVPTVMGAIDLPFSRLENAQVIVDGYAGRVIVNPADELLAQYREMLQAELAERRELESCIDQPCMLASGERVQVMVNSGLASAFMHALSRGAEGVGLYRTEVPFLIRERFPTEEEQRLMYREQLQAYAPRPVTMRTLDVGGDKALPYFPIEEENPFLGWRGIRVTLDHPEIFLAQVRAMLKASLDLNNLKVMLPMISSVAEIDESIALLERAHEEVVEEGWAVPKPQVGVMVEVPAAVYQAQQLAERTDFLSVGSNDLTQYLLAVDRNNARVASIYDTFHPAVLLALKQAVDGAHAAGKPITICGEIAGDPTAALLLVAMGFDGLSMSAVNIARIKSALGRFELSEVQSMLAAVLAMDDSKAIRRYLDDELQRHGLHFRARAG